MATDRLEDARVLLEAGRFSAAYYLSGYAADCWLKAYIAGNMKDAKFPKRANLKDAWTHDLELLLRIASLEARWEMELNHDDKLEKNWAILKDWSGDSRYEDRREGEARDMFSALTDPNNGVLKCLEKFSH